MVKYFSIFMLTFLLSLTVMGGQAAFAEGSFAATSGRAISCGVSPESVGQVEALVREGGLTDAEGAILISPLLAACEKHLPSAPFEDKLAEGLAKRVAPQRINAALDAKLSAYGVARALLERHLDPVDPNVLSIVGEGLCRGAERQDFESFIAQYHAQPAKEFLAGVEMVSLLGQIDFDSVQTHAMIEAGFNSGGLTPQWRYIIRIVLVARQRGLSDTVIGEAATAVLAEGGAVSDVSARLGFTSRNLTGRSNSN